MKQKFKPVLIIFFVFAVGILTAGCNGGGPTSSETPFIGGTTGLLMSFMEDAPPIEIYDGGEFTFPVVIKLKNEGEWDIAASDVQIKISGVDPGEFSLQPGDLVNHPEEDLVGTVKDAEGNVIDGTMVYVEFYGFNYADKLSGNIQLPLRADVCYTYGTKVDSKLCIKEDLYDTNENSLCVVVEEKQAYSSSAPLQVISLKESVRGESKIGFTFTIEHKGNGGIFEKGSVCDTTGITYENKVWVEVDTGIQGLKCNGLQSGTDSSGYITMYSGTRAVTCTQPIDAVTDYEKVIHITLEYDYKEDINTQLLVKHTIG